MSRPLTILGIDSANEIVFTFHPDEPGKELTLGESDLIELTKAIEGDYLPLWPRSECHHDGCTNDSVATIEGRDTCEPHAWSWTQAEMESGRWGK